MQVREEGGEPGHGAPSVLIWLEDPQPHGNKYTAPVLTWGEGSERGAGRPEEEETCGQGPE